MLMHYVRSVLLNLDCRVKSSRGEAHLDNTLKVVSYLQKTTLHLDLQRTVCLWK